MVIRFAGDSVAHNTILIRGLEKKHSVVHKDKFVINVDVILVSGGGIE